MPAPSRSSPPRTSLLPLAAVAAAFLVHAGFLAAVVDDAYITFRYARNLVGGHGWTWNVGEAPVEGFTSVLWVLVSAAAQAAGLDVARAAQAAGVLASLATLAVVFAFGRRRLGLSPRGALVPPVILAAGGPFATWATSGMETNLFAFLVTAAAYAWTGAPGPRRVVGTAALLGLAAWTRPEGLGVLALFLVAGVVARVRGRGAGAPPAGEDARLAALALVPVAALVAWRFATFGDVVPNTFHAKTGMSAYIPLRGLVYVAYFAAFYLAPWVPAWTLRARVDPAPATPRFALDLLVTLVAGWTLYVVAVGGDYMAMHRFFVPVLPAFDLLVGAVIARALAAPGRRAWVVAAAAFGLAGTLVHSTPLDVHLFGRPRAQQGNYEGVVNERRAVARFAAVGRWFGAHRARPDEVLATKVIGAMGWYADVRVLDMFGLTDRHIARAGRSEKPLGLGFPGHERTDLGYVAARRPTWIFLELAERPRRVSHPDWNPAANDLLNQEYVVRGERIEVPGQGPAWLYFLERKDRVPTTR